MALTFKYGAAAGQQFHCDSKLWLTADRQRLVPDGDPEAAFLFCISGRAIPLEEAERYGLIRREPEVMNAVIFQELPKLPDLLPDPILEPDEPEAPDDSSESETPRRVPRRPRKA